MFYHPHDYTTGLRDVIAAWLVCLAVAATGFAYAEVSAVPGNRAAEARTAPQYTPPTVLRTAICDARRSAAEMPPG